MFFRRSLTRTGQSLYRPAFTTGVSVRAMLLGSNVSCFSTGKGIRKGRTEKLKSGGTGVNLNSFNLHSAGVDALGNPVTALKVAPLMQPADGAFLSHGVLRNLPLIPTAEEQRSTCISRAKSLKVAKYVTGDKEKSKDLYLRKQTVTTEFVLYRLDKLQHVIPPSCAWLHPLERTIVGLTLGKDLDLDEDAAITRDIFELHAQSGEAEFEVVARQLKRLRNKVASEFERYEKQQKACRSKDEADRVFSEGSHQLLEQIAGSEASGVLEACKVIVQRLRDTNSIDPYAPTIALVGAPNVGKSSLVKVLSSGKPEVQNYPFTTRSIICGHLNLDLYGDGSSVKVQVTDTPGLLDRPDRLRRRMEMQTLAALEHLRQVIVVFVYDPAGLSGTSLESQFRQRQELRWRYHKLIPAAQWFDVATKADLWKLSDAQREVRENEYQERQDRLWIKLQAEKLQLSEGRVVAEIAAAEQSASQDVTWDLEFHQKMRLFDVFGDVVLDRVEKVYRDAKGEVISTERMEEVLGQPISREQKKEDSASFSVSSSSSSSNNSGTASIDIPFVVNSVPLVPSSESVDSRWNQRTALEQLPPRPKSFTEPLVHTFEVSTARSHDWESEEQFWRKAFGLDFEPEQKPIPMARGKEEEEGQEKLVFGLEETTNCIASAQQEEVPVMPLQQSMIEDEYNVRSLKTALKKQLQEMLRTTEEEEEE